MLFFFTQSVTEQSLLCCLISHYKSRQEFSSQFYKCHLLVLLCEAHAGDGVSPNTEHTEEMLWELSKDERFPHSCGNGLGTFQINNNN